MTIRSKLHLRKPRRFLIWLVLSGISAMLIGLPPGTPLAWGQNRGTTLEVLPPQLRQLERNFPVLNELLVSETADVARGVVRLDGRRLFTIAVPVAVDSSASSNPNQISSEGRVRLIEERLQQWVDRDFDPLTLEATAEVDPNSRQPIIYLSAEADGEPIQEELMTVTALDAEINGASLEEWADLVSERVEEALVDAQQERQPEYLRRQALVAGGILLAIGILSWSLTSLQRRLQIERHDLFSQTRAASQELSVATTELGNTPEMTTVLLQQRAANQQRQKVNDIQRRLLQLGQLLTWVIGLFVIVGLFPYSRWLQPLILRWLQVPARLLAIGIITYVAIRVSELLVDRLFWALQSSTDLAPSTSQRLILRFTTFSRVAKSIAVALVGGIGLLTAIGALGIQISPALLTLAGVVGVGISLASQNLIKDIINGFLILLEDQYGVGDVIIVGDVSGFVENMNLRITQLRNEEGRLITIPNSAISVVQNLSKEWSRVDLSVSVAYEADLDQALAVTKQVAQDMSEDPVWKDLILEPPQLLGVDRLDYAGATIRLWIKTQPLKQWDVAREYRRRLKLAFDRAGIPIGIPQQSLWLSTPAEGGLIAGQRQGANKPRHSKELDQ